MDGPGASLLGGQRIAIDDALMGNPLIELDPMVAAEQARLKHELVQAEGDEAAAVKVEAFTFTRYGLSHGTVVGVGRDAVIDDRARQAGQDKRTNSDGEDSQNDDTPPGYTAHIALGQTKLMTENGPAKLEAGMAVTTEIKTKRRSVISYLQSPLQRYAHEGIRER